MKRLQIPQKLLHKQFYVHKKVYVHKIAAVDLSKKRKENFYAK